MSALDHVTLTTDDLGATAAFYDAALSALGMERVAELVDEEEEEPELEAVAWDAPGRPGAIWVISGGASTSGVHLRVRANSRAEVETFFHRSVEAGGRQHAAPRRWTLYRPGEFNAIVVDPAGNLVEAVASE